MNAIAGAALSPERALHIVVRVGAERFAFPVFDVEEALDAPVVEWVPIAPAGLLGQLRHRGRMVSAWDAGWAFGLARAARAGAGAGAGAGTGAGAALVLRDGPRRLALVVDDVVEIARLEADGMRAVPFGSDLDGVLSGVCLSPEGGGSIVNVVRVEALVARAAVSDTFGSGSAR